MRKCLLLLLGCLFIQIAEAASYRVEVAVFERAVGSNYFYNLDDVQLMVDVNDLHRYYLGDFSDRAEADRVRNDAVAKGYRYAKVVDLDAKRAACAASCAAPIYVRNIFFDFDQSYLRQKSKNDLDQLALLLQDNPGYKVELSAHTDSRGSLEYNTALSQRRAQSAKAYLLKKGIAAGRVTTSEFGETSPIAKNDLNGQDSPEGRQFNRRVVVLVIDANGKVVSNVVEPIGVPDKLKMN